MFLIWPTRTWTLLILSQCPTDSGTPGELLVPPRKAMFSLDWLGTLLFEAFQLSKILQWERKSRMMAAPEANDDCKSVLAILSPLYVSSPYKSASTKRGSLGASHTNFTQSNERSRCREVIVRDCYFHPHFITLCRLSWIAGATLKFPAWYRG